MHKNNGKRRAALLAAIGLVMTISAACVPTEQTGINRTPNFEQTKDVELDYTQLYNDVVESFGDEEENPYSFIKSFDISGDDEKRVVTVTASCVDGATKEDVEQFAAAALRRINDAAVTQSNEYSMSSQETFGSFWDKYALNLTVTPLSAGDDASKALLHLDIKAGEAIPLNPDIETYEEAWQEERGRILSSMENEANGQSQSGESAEGQSTEDQSEAVR